MNQQTELTVNPSTTIEFYSGYVNTQGTRVQVDFVVPGGATSEEKDAAFVASLAQQADLNYLMIGESRRASMVDRKVPRTQRNFVEVRFEMDGFSIDTAKLDLATGSVFDVHAVPPWYDDQRDAVIVVCRKAIPVTREGSGLYAVDQEQLVGLKDAVLDDLGAGLKVRLVDGLIKDVFTVWEAGTDVASCNDVACATRVAKALRRAGSTENIWVTRGSEFENVYDDPKPEVQPSRSPLIV